MQDKLPSLDRVARYLDVIVPAVGILALIVFGAFCFRPAMAIPGPTQQTLVETLPPTHTATPTATVTPSTTSTATATVTATSTVTATPTPTPTPTSTPTALPVTIRGNAESVPSRAPIPQEGAPCGVVDKLDFPLDPPDGRTAYGGGDFGRYRSRYGLYHAGEDWSFRSSQSSFGKPVHSIGHGVITYAQPLGWGLDQGVVIVRHVFSDGDTILSFYGHLDPESVVLKAGDCVARGDTVGRIGKPRTSSHLHFEIRSHMPTEPGRGYATKEPSLLGWRDPSAFIWQQRIAASPGVLWTQPFGEGKTKGIGMLDENTYLVLQEDELVALDVRDGRICWRHIPEPRLYDALVHPDDRMLYVTSVFGVLQALRPSAAPQTGANATGQAPLEPVWEIELDEVIFPDLMPLPGGGVGLSTRRAGQGSAVIGVSSDGEELWEEEAALRSSSWVLAGDRLVVSGVGGEIWILDREGPTALHTGAGDRLARASGNAVLTYDEEGIHRVDLDTRRIEPLYALPGGFPGYGDLVVLQPDAVYLPNIVAPDDRTLSSSDLLVTHRDAGGDSLTALAADGTLRWRRSYERVLREQQRLLSFEGHAYLVSQIQGLSYSEISVYEIDVPNAELLRVFTGGSRNPTAADTWFAPVGDGRLLIHIGGTGMLVLDTHAAHMAIEDR